MLYCILLGFVMCLIYGIFQLCFWIQFTLGGCLTCTFSFLNVYVEDTICIALIGVTSFMLLFFQPSLKETTELVF